MFATPHRMEVVTRGITSIFNYAKALLAWDLCHRQMGPNWTPIIIVGATVSNRKKEQQLLFLTALVFTLRRADFGTQQEK